LIRLLRLVYIGQENWSFWHLSFLSDLKELNQTAPRFMTQELDRNQCIPWTSAEIFPGWGIAQILLILYRLLTMQCK